MSNYWLERSRQRLVKSELIGLDAMNRILPVYELALRNINKEINSIYVNYSNKVGLDVSELTKILSGVDKNNFLKSIQVKMRRLGFNVGDIYDKNYIARLTRLEALKQQVYWEIQNIAPREIDISSNAYRRIILESYNSSRLDIREQLGASGGFATINQSAVNEMLLNRWEGGNYSTRIWGNTDILANKLQVVITSGLTVGTSQEKMALQIRERVDVGKYNAMRLVRTETNYFQNQAELQSYKDEGIEYYRYDGIQDGRTSDFCKPESEGGMDGTVWKVSEAEVGYNYPPLHPNCRSSTQVVFPNEVNQPSTEGFDFSEVYEAQMAGLEEQGFKRR